MTASDFIALLPILVLTGSILAVLLGITIYRCHKITAGLSALGLLLSLAVIPLAQTVEPGVVTPLLLIDGYGWLFSAIFLVSSLLVTFLCYGYYEGSDRPYEEIYLLILIATLGSIILAVSNHFISLFLGLETLTVSLYVLIAYQRDQYQSIEAGIKYLVLAATASAILLFGMAMVYARVGSMELPIVAETLMQGSASPDLFLLVGLGLLIVGAGFKLALVPFHMWTPDIYQAASPPVTAFVATVSKGGMLALLLRYLVPVDVATMPTLAAGISVLAIFSMFVGNLLALMQNNVVRILAYSSIAHFGYIITAVLASGELALQAGAYYLTAYFATTITGFGLIGMMQRPDSGSYTVDDWRGLFWHKPGYAAAFTVVMLSLAGIPLTGGFIGKFYVVAAGIDSQLWGMILALILSSTIGLYYYLRLVMVMTMQSDKPASPIHMAALPCVAVTVASVAILALGILPAPFLGVIDRMLTTMV